MCGSLGDQILQTNVCIFSLFLIQTRRFWMLVTLPFIWEEMNHCFFISDSSNCTVGTRTLVYLPFTLWTTAQVFQVGIITDFTSISSWHRWLRGHFKLTLLTSWVFQVGVDGFASISNWHRWLREHFKLASPTSRAFQVGIADSGGISSWHRWLREHFTSA